MISNSNRLNPPPEQIKKLERKRVFVQRIATSSAFAFGVSLLSFISINTLSSLFTFTLLTSTLGTTLCLSGLATYLAHSWLRQNILLPTFVYEVFESRKERILTSLRCSYKTVQSFNDLNSRDLRLHVGSLYVVGTDRAVYFMTLKDGKVDTFSVHSKNPTFSSPKTAIIPDSLPKTYYRDTRDTRFLH